jgi:hypothetical protein
MLFVSKSRLLVAVGQNHMLWGKLLVPPEELIGLVIYPIFGQHSYPSIRCKRGEAIRKKVTPPDSFSLF